MRYKSHATEDRQTEMFLLRTLPDKILSFEEKFGGMKMLVTVLCLTYMMIVILIHMVWITSIIKQNMN